MNDLNKVFNILCHLQIESALFLIDFHFKSAHLSFGFFKKQLEHSPSALWECEFRKAESKSLWEVRVPQGGIHALHNDVISTKLL